MDDEVIPGSGIRGKPRRMAHMVSVRLEGELIRALRNVARHRGVTLSELLREGAELVLEGEETSRSTCDYTIYGMRAESPPFKGTT